MGTNGEFVLALDEERSFIASVPLGPSLEGIGLRHGGVADTGSVSGFALGPFGLTPRVIGDAAPRRICGTGYLSLLDVLLRIGLIEPTGRLSERPASPLALRLLASVTRGASGWSLPLPGGLALFGADVEEILKVKAAFSLAFECLLDAAGLESRDVARVHLGGALGEYASGEALETLGFLPPGLRSRVTAAGNTSLRGASLLLRRRTAGTPRALEPPLRVDGPDRAARLHGLVHASYGFRISVFRLHESRFCGIASLSEG